MRSAIKVLAVAGLAMSTMAVPARAQLQEVHRHRGFWLGFGLGGGWDDWNFDFGEQGRGGAGYFRLGGTVNRHVLLGGEALVWFQDTNAGPDLERDNVSLTALIYPGPDGGLFFKGGFGVAAYQVGSGSSVREGVGVTLGTGFDFKIARNLFITPNVDVMTQFFRDATNTSVLFTVGLGWH